MLVLLPSLTISHTHSFPNSHSLSLDFLLIEEIAVGPGEFGRKCWFCAFLVLAVIDLGCQWPSLQASLRFFRCISKEFHHFQGLFQFYKPAFLHLNIMYVETHVILSPHWGFCIMLWHVYFYSLDDLVYVTFL